MKHLYNFEEFVNENLTNQDFHEEVIEEGKITRAAVSAVMAVAGLFGSPEGAEAQIPTFTIINPTEKNIESLESYKAPVKMEDQKGIVHYFNAPGDDLPHTFKDDKPNKENYVKVKRNYIGLDKIDNMLPEEKPTRAGDTLYLTDLVRFVSRQSRISGKGLVWIREELCKTKATTGDDLVKIKDDFYKWTPIAIKGEVKTAKHYHGHGAPPKQVWSNCNRMLLPTYR